MNRIARALHLPFHEQLQAARALAWLVIVRAALAVLPYDRIRRRAERVRPAPRSRATVESCRRALARAHAVLPGSRCLPLAIAGECLLRRAGVPARVVIGVVVDRPSRLDAHAWLESNGIVVTGAAQAARYTRLQ